MHLGMGEMLVILLIALLVFGPSKMPQLGDALGKGIRNFKRAVDGADPEERRLPAKGEQGSSPSGESAAAPATPEKR